MASVSAATAPADLVGVSIVLIGPFDPMVLQPSNLISNGLLSSGDMDALRYDILAPEISVLRLPWLQVVVEPTKLTAATTLENPLAEPVRDFVVALQEIRAIKTITEIGLNHDRHFAATSQEVWHRIGHVLSPKEVVWNKVLSEPGLLSLAIRGKRDDQWDGGVNVRVEPSTRITPGIYVSVNDHFRPKPDTLADAKPLIEVLNEDWAPSMARLQRIVQSIKELAA